MRAVMCLPPRPTGMDLPFTVTVPSIRSRPWRSSLMVKARRDRHFFVLGAVKVTPCETVVVVAGVLGAAGAAVTVTVPVAVRVWPLAGRAVSVIGYSPGAVPAGT